MALFRRSRHTVGLDIGSGFVKAVLMDHSAHLPRLLRLASLPLVADAIVEGEIMDPPLVVDTIRAVMQTLGVRTRSVVTAIGGRDVIVKKIQIERMPEADAREVMSWEAAQYVPFDMEDVQLDFQILDPEADGLQMDVLLVAAKKELVEQRSMLLADAGLSAAIIDVDAFALFNAFEYTHPTASPAPSALVDIGHEVATILVHEGGVPLVTREFSFGSKQLREELRRMHGLSAEEAERALRGQAAQDAEVERSLYERGAELALAIERATAFLDLDAPGMSGLGTIHFSGGGARIPRLQEAIADRLRVRIDILNPLERLEVAPEALPDLPDPDAAPMWMLPIGLGFRVPA